jgi:hypothetical protein
MSPQNGLVACWVNEPHAIDLDDLHAAVLGVLILVKGIYYDHGSAYTWPLFFAMVLVALGQVFLLHKQGERPTRSRSVPVRLNAQSRLDLSRVIVVVSR